MRGGGQLLKGTGSRKRVMTHQDAFLQDILEHPEDDSRRRVYADWLLDHPDPVAAARGELIQLQCDLARTLPTAPRSAELVRREKALLAEHGPTWGADFLRLGCTCWEYRRGFVEGVGIPAAAFLAHGATLFRLAPLREVKLYAAGGSLAELADSPLLDHLRALDLEHNDLVDADLHKLADSPFLGRLTTLLLWCNRIGDAGLTALAGATLPRLRRLDLSRNQIGDAGVRGLANAPLLGQLHLLDLTSNQIGDGGARALAAAPDTAALTWLDLSRNPISPAGQQALRERFGGRVQAWG